MWSAIVSVCVCHWLQSSQMMTIFSSEANFEFTIKLLSLLVKKIKIKLFLKVNVNLFKYLFMFNIFFTGSEVWLLF